MVKGQPPFPSHPATTYAQAQRRVAQLRAHEEGSIRPDSRTQLLGHGKKTARAVVMFHGFTNSPAQYRLLAKIMYDNGYNVLLPRLAYHGFVDLLTRDQQKLQVTDMVGLTQESVDIAQGLGEQVTVVGLSAGGVMAAWAAQFRPDVAYAVVISPFLGLAFLPRWGSWLLRSVLPHVPNFFVWWDPRMKDKIDGPPHAYPWFSTHSMAQILRLASAVVEAARHDPPAAKTVTMVTNAFDAAVNVLAARALAKQWRVNGAQVLRYEFSKNQRIWHDLIDPSQKTQRVADVYPILVSLIGGTRMKLPSAIAEGR